MKIIGLTGGIGSGKSAVAARFAELGLPVIDADKVGHDVIAPGGAAEHEVKAAFGNDILRDGRIDRELLAARVFAEPQALQTLNSIMHPAITAEIGRRCAKYACQENIPAVLIEATLIGERGKRDAWLDALILVDAPLETRLERLVAHRGMSREDALNRIKAQSDPLAKRAIADWVIDNSADFALARDQADQIYQQLIESADD